MIVHFRQTLAQSIGELHEDGAVLLQAVAHKDAMLLEGALQDLRQADSSFEINLASKRTNTTLLHVICLAGFSPALFVALAPESLDFSLRDKVYFA